MSPVSPNAHPRAVRRPSAAGSPRRRGAERRDQILDAAAKSFREVGYGGCSLETVAAEVGILKGSLYYHFASKEEILAELLLDVHRDALVMIEDVVRSQGTGMERVEGYVTAHARWVLRHLDRVEVFLRDYHYLPAERARQVAALRRRFSNCLTMLITEAQRDGAADFDLDPRVAANSIHGMLNWIGTWYRRRGASGMSDDALVAQITRQAVRGLLPSERSGGSASERFPTAPTRRPGSAMRSARTGKKA